MLKICTFITNIYINRFNSIGDFDFFIENLEDSSTMILLETLSYNAYNILPISYILTLYVYIKEKIKDLYREIYI